MITRPHVPDLPQTPDLDSPEERRAFERRAAEEAMESEHQVFAGSARHVGGVEFDDPGVFEIDEAEEDPDTLGRYAEPTAPAATPRKPRRRRPS
ncbi:hypothetical protein [Caulobacter sp. 17J65-9]|uniref:hypothetical protein n=1 Tax=Caulobacter sp. 17J65-9 TaxID=2709382 RepID=UPI0013C87064|nr:hypothetical protein [Caulobacter sp. 17J65-9]NEX94299.1 hypothetical protein [Caulobacter sp. 17J65-9]